MRPQRKKQLLKIFFFKECTNKQRVILNLYSINDTVVYENRCPHIKPQPDKQGKIYWLSGPPGAGKSTTCQLMAREKGYIYYEADCTPQLINPFTDLNAENPSMASFTSKPLKVIIKIYRCYR